MDPIKDGRLAPSLLTLQNQLASDPYYSPYLYCYWFPNAEHISEGSASDHNNWLFNMYRAIDIMPIGDIGMQRCYELRTMWNKMFAAGDTRCMPKGYTNGPDDQITDWDNPGGLHYSGNDEGHLHVSASQVLAGCNRTDPWPLTHGGVAPEDDFMSDAQYNAVMAEFNMQRPLIAYRDAMPGAIGTVELLGPGFRWHVPNYDYLGLLATYRWCQPVAQIFNVISDSLVTGKDGVVYGNVYNFIRDFALVSPPALGFDPAEVKAALDAAVASMDFSKLNLPTGPSSAAIADELAKRLQS